MLAALKNAWFRYREQSGRPRLFAHDRGGAFCPAASAGYRKQERMVDTHPDPVNRAEQESAMAARARAVASIKIDEPHVRVIEYRFPPGAETGWHRHGHDYVVVPLLDGQLLLEQPDGTSRVAELRTHQPYAREAGVEHNVINANAFEFGFLEIELLR
jgi:quercetin dioxygenase-like cupin family protein